VDLASLADPRHTTVLCMEMERGVVGDLCTVPGPADAVRESGIIPRCASLFDAARRAGMRVVHCVAAFRADRAGSYRNIPSVNRFLDNPEHLLVGSPSVEVVPELWHPDDLQSIRYHGIAPFIGTSLDSTLRSLRTRTVIATGVSLNRGIIGTSMGAVDNGYDVVVPVDAVAGYPAEYGKLVLRHTLDGLTTLSSVDELVAAWTKSGSLS
jgi:nicotinamidase-related amidase